MISAQPFIFATLALIIFAFWFAFERSHPTAGDLVLIAELCAFSIACRAVFSFVPYFTPVMAVFLLTGVTLGSIKGFVVGSLTALVSNFFFGQGPWTLYQMVSWGLLGAIFGLEKNFVKKEFALMTKKQKFLRCLVHCVCALIIIPFVTGPISDLSGVFMFSVDSINSLFVLFANGFIFNLILAVSTVFTLFVFEFPFLYLLNRVIQKQNLLS